MGNTSKGNFIVLTQCIHIGEFSIIFKFGIVTDTKDIPVHLDNCCSITRCTKTWKFKNDVRRSLVFQHLSAHFDASYTGVPLPNFY